MSPFSSGLSMLVSKCGKARPTLPCLVPGPGRLGTNHNLVTSHMICLDQDASFHLEDCGPVVSVEPSSSMIGRSSEAKYCCVLKDRGEAPEKRPPRVG